MPCFNAIFSVGSVDKFNQFIITLNKNETQEGNASYDILFLKIIGDYKKNVNVSICLLCVAHQF